VPRLNPITPIYVGKGKGKRAYIHLGNGCTNAILRSKILHIRESKLEPIIFFVKENLSCQDALDLEKQLIKEYGRICNDSGILCNFTEGGEGTDGYKHNINTLELFSKQRRGKKQTQAQYAANCNRIITKEHREKISKSQIGIDRLSPETRKIIAEKNRGRKASELTRLKMSLQRKGKKQTEAQYLANCNRPRRTKEIKCLNNDKIYNNSKEAAEDLNLNKSSVVSAANGQRPSINGYKFVYTNNLIINCIPRSF
jgi:hypothetical protein